MALNITPSRTDTSAYEDFGAGYSLFCFNLEADVGHSGNVLLIKMSNIRLETRFRNRTVTLICYSVFDSVTEISNMRQVLLLLQQTQK